jgi:hypothetical protein
LIRRLSFDLTGLPPTMSEVEAFLADSSSDAYEKLVDRLLASPHYGERWARHWLDLMRYAETLGHEFDYELFHAWRYRDYVIRAFNDDVPYNQFVIEHLAGDLLAEPRRHPSKGFNESILGTGFYWLGEAKHSPVDLRQEQTDKIDNQIDVLGKAFLAQTIACARCHDHKFDAITAQDYYALAGYLKSTRYQQAAIDPPERIRAKAEKLAELHRQISELAAKLLQRRWRKTGETFAQYLQTAAGPQGTQETDAGKVDHPLFVWRRLIIDQAKERTPFTERARQLRQDIQVKRLKFEESLAATACFEDFTEATASRWFVSGEAFELSSVSRSDLLMGQSAERPIEAWLPPGCVHSGRLSRKLEGALRSNSFTLQKPYVHLRVAGESGRVNLVIDGFNLIRNPIYGGLSFELKEQQPVWRTIDVSMWQGHRAYFELLDCSVPNLSQPLPDDKRQGKSADDWLLVDEIRFSDDKAPPQQPPNAVSLEVLADPLPQTPQDLAARYASYVAQILKSKPTSADAAALINLLLNEGLRDLAPASADDVGGDNAAYGELASLLKKYRELEQSIPAPNYALAASDGTGEDEAVLNRGNYRTPGEPAPRRLSEVFCSQPQPAPEQGSGRLEMARRLIDPSNPLPARVIVNRLWHHHFGHGIVRSPDDFGRMGQPPTHPELLDYLATELVRGGWSLKKMHRQMLLSRTYQMASRGSAAAEIADPENRLWHRLPIRRLEAEAIRDAVLAVSGRLDRTLYGPSVPPHLTPFMEGRGRPGSSGPLDGDGRRTLYINVRRNFLTPMLLAFDYPIPFSSMGRRSVSNVPAQALAMMNGPFVAEQAVRWAEQALTDTSLSAEARVQLLYQTALARPASDSEVEEAIAFLSEQSQRYGKSGDNTQPWTDLCHVLLNTKEFIFID